MSPNWPRNKLSGQKKSVWEVTGSQQTTEESDILTTFLICYKNSNTITPTIFLDNCLYYWYFIYYVHVLHSGVVPAYIIESVYVYMHVYSLEASWSLRDIWANDQSENIPFSKPFHPLSIFYDDLLLLWITVSQKLTNKNPLRWLSKSTSRNGQSPTHPTVPINFHPAAFYQHISLWIWTHLVAMETTQY